MQGLFVDFNRPKSKKAVKEALADDPARVTIEATSVFGNEYEGPVADMPEGTIYFVGPDPYTSRKFYGSIDKTGGAVVIK